MWLDRISPRPNTLWRGSWRGHFVEPARFLYDHELVLISRGKVRFEAENQSWDLEKGSFILIPPDTKHVSLARDASVFRSCIHFDWVASGPPVRRPFCCYYPHRPVRRWVMRKPSFVPLRLMVGRYASDGAIPALVETLFLRWQSGEAFDRALCRGALLELLVQLFYPRSRRTPRRDRVSPLAYAAKERLDHEGQWPETSIITLLETLGYSYPHVCRLFRSHFGVTPVEYLNARRLERAKVLLLNPRLTISEIAFAVGFRDAGYFSRKFRAQTGLPPGRFSRERSAL